MTALCEKRIEILDLPTKLLDLSNKAVKSSENRGGSRARSVWLFERDLGASRLIDWVGTQYLLAIVLVFQRDRVVLVRIMEVIRGGKPLMKKDLVLDWVPEKPGFEASMSAGCQCSKCLRETEIRANVVRQEIFEQRDQRFGERVLEPDCMGLYYAGLFLRQRSRVRQSQNARGATVRFKKRTCILKVCFIGLPKVVVINEIFDQRE